MKKWEVFQDKWGNFFKMNGTIYIPVFFIKKLDRRFDILAKMIAVGTMKNLLK